MGRINVLDKQVAELIAAGEVVERPSSVIKELCENSIDAGAATVTVEIKNGGISFMRVTDNGCGIQREDVPKAFLRHATSKVKNQPDLDSIGTLGFRGEALASVCAVSRVELLTRSADEEIGTAYRISGGEEQDISDAGCPVGTTIIVRDLFYNVPARLKFLKKDITEGNSVAGVMDRIALSHPETAVTFIRDGKKAMSTSGDGNLLSSVYGVFGRDFAVGLIPVEYELNGVKIKGFVSKPENARPNRSMQYFFINGRYIKSRTASAALEEACKGTVMTGKFPSCVIHIEIPFSTVDVNVHPAKIEVRFVNERPIFDAVYHGIKTAFLSANEVKEITLNVEKPKDFTFSGYKTAASAMEDKAPIKSNNPNSADYEKPVLTEKIKNNNISPEEDSEPEIFIPKKIQPTVIQREEKLNIVSDIDKLTLYSDKNAEGTFSEVPEKTNEPIRQISDNSAGEESVKDKENLIVEKPVQERLPETEDDSLRLVGEVFDTYIILQRGRDELFLVDKHAAHERLIYERLKKEKGQAYHQLLLVPVTVTLCKEEYDAVVLNSELLKKAGYDTEDFGGGTILVRSVPQYIESGEIAASIMEIAGYLSQHRNTVTTEKTDWIYHNTACRAAIKAGDKSHTQELIALVSELLKNPDLRHCPHGRPIMTAIKKKELEKQFGRI